jgi:hypothetical protein
MKKVVLSSEEKKTSQRNGRIVVKIEVYLVSKMDDTSLPYKGLTHFTTVKMEDMFGIFIRDFLNVL